MKFFNKKYLFAVTSIIFLVIGYFLGQSHQTKHIDKILNSTKRSLTEIVASTVGLNDRKLVLMENPSLINRIMKGGAFGNENFSISAAQNMFGKDEDAIQDVIDKTEIVQIEKNIWTIKLPIVNCSVIETDEGLIVIDTGMKPAGPAILKSIRSISKKSIHTIIYTHGHVDHAYGTWALIEDERIPQIIAHENLLRRFQRYIDLHGSLAKYMSQPFEQLPTDSTDLVWPTLTFSDELKLEIGGVTFFLKHFEGETDDQLFVWMPDQKIVFAADYYQGFLPNAGNGKRIARNVGEWINALKYMAELKPDIMVPSHGEVIFNKDSIHAALDIHAEAMEYIFEYTINALNQGTRKDVIADQFIMPEKFKNHPLLNEQYVTSKDICKMIIKHYTGWWDDIPSHWSPSSMQQQANSIVELAGGMDNLINYIYELIPQDLVLASHFIDWAYFSDPDNTEVHELILEIYKKRILDERSMTQEMLVYLDHMAEVRARMK